MRAIAPEDAMKISLPRCNEENGNFEQIQCNGSDVCWCVQADLGYEIPDTRAEKGQQVDCTTGQSVIYFVEFVHKRLEDETAL